MLWLALTYGFTVAGILLGLTRPFYGLLIYIAFAILKPEGLWFWAVPGDNYSRIIGIALLLGWALHGFGNWQLGRARGTVVALVLLMSWSILGAFQAKDQWVAWKFVEELAKIVLPFLVGITTVDSVVKLRRLAWTMFLCEGYLAFDFNRDYLGGFNRLVEVGFGAMDNNSVGIALVTAAGLGFFLCLQERGWRRVLAVGFTACLGHAVLISMSRGAMLALAITAVVTFLLIPRQPKHYLAFGLAVLLALQFTGPEIRNRFSTIFAGEKERDASAGSRLELWGNCVDVMANEPFFGAGPRHFPLIVHQYGWKKGKEAHSLWLQLGAELGVPGLLFVLAFYGLTGTRLWRMARGREEVEDPWMRTAACMVIASLTGFAVSAQFVSLELLELPYYVALLGAGILKVASVSHAVSAAAEVDGEQPETAYDWPVAVGSG